MVSMHLILRQPRPSYQMESSTCIRRTSAHASECRAPDLGDNQLNFPGICLLQVPLARCLEWRSFSRDWSCKAKTVVSDLSLSLLETDTRCAKV